jgi:hypothetical protein
MAHRMYISDPGGHGIAERYELPTEIWVDIDAAGDYSERLPAGGDELLVDTTDNPVFTKRS